MARRTKEEAERTRQSLLEAALNVFLEKGYSKTTLQDIASAAQLTRGAVYWHFKNKKDVYHALMDTVFEPIHIFWDKARTSSAPPLDVISSLLEDWLHQLAANTRLVQALELHFMKTEQGIELKEFVEARRKENSEHLRLVEMLFDRAQVLGHCRSDLDPRSAAVNFWALLLGYAFSRLQLGEAIDWAGHTSEFVQMYLASVSHCEK